MDDSLRNADGQRLHLRRWPLAGPARGTVQLVHGLGEHIGRYEALAGELNAAGWQVVGHDQRGHGRSEGPRGDIARPDALFADLALVVDHVRRREAPAQRQVLLGHSHGGLVAARFIGEALAPQPAAWSRPFDGLVLSSPALEAGLGPVQKLLLTVLGSVAPHLGVHNGLKPRWISRDPDVVKRYVQDPLVHARVTPVLVRCIVDAGVLLRDRAPQWQLPTLLMWAGADRCVVPAGSARFAAAAPPAVLSAQLWPALFHEMFNEPERKAVVAHLTRWLARF